MSHDVVLHVYDLSMGMARTLSPMLLGKMIEIIPHTGVVYQNKEYFFGGGIQVLPPHQVVEYFGLPPVERMVLGRSSKSEEELRTFLRSISHRFTMETYDLFKHNCNNFSHELAQFLAGASVPSKILDVPAQVLSTPMGSMIGDMMRKAQSNMASRLGTGGSWDPFTARAGGGLPSGATFSGTGAPASAAPAERAAAAAGMPAQTAAAAGGAGVAPTADATAAGNASFRLSAGHSGALVAAEAGNVAAVLARLERINSSLPEGSPHKLSVEELQQLACFPALQLISPLDSGSAAAPSALASSGPSAAAVLARVCRLVGRLLRTWPREQAAFPVLCLLRLLALRADCIGHLIASSGEGESGGVMWDVLEACSAVPVAAGAGTVAPAAGMFGAGPSNVMALASLANAFKTQEGAAWASQPAVSSKLMETALRQLGPQHRSDVRQMAAAIAYNQCISLPLGSDSAGNGVAGSGLQPSAAPGDATVLVSDSSVQLLCGLLEGCAAESEPEVLRRRLLGAGRLLQREGPAAGELMATLGMGEVIKAVADGSCGIAGGPSAELRGLAAEVAALIVPLTAF